MEVKEVEMERLRTVNLLDIIKWSRHMEVLSLQCFRPIKVSIKINSNLPHFMAKSPKMLISTNMTIKLKMETITLCSSMLIKIK